LAGSVLVNVLPSRESEPGPWYWEKSQPATGSACADIDSINIDASERSLIFIFLYLSG
jgi:hypothetical protein